MVTKSKKYKNVVYMRVSRDKYELPEAVASTAQELGEILGVTANTILSAISHGHKTYVRVSMEDEE